MVVLYWLWFVLIPKSSQLNSLDCLLNSVHFFIFVFIVHEDVENAGNQKAYADNPLENRFGGGSEDRADQVNVNENFSPSKVQK